MPEVLKVSDLREDRKERSLTLADLGRERIVIVKRIEQENIILNQLYGQLFGIDELIKKLKA